MYLPSGKPPGWGWGEGSRVRRAKQEKSESWTPCLTQYSVLRSLHFPAILDKQNCYIATGKQPETRGLWRDWAWDLGKAVCQYSLHLSCYLLHVWWATYISGRPMGTQGYAPVGGQGVGLFRIILTTGGFHFPCPFPVNVETKEHFKESLVTCLLDRKQHCS